MLVDLEAETDFLQDRVGLVLTGLTSLHRGFVLVLAEVHQLANRRLGRRRHLYEIKIGFEGEAQRVFNADDADLLAVRSDQPHLGDADSIINAWIADV
ncbi:hypothetical protein GCM10023081_35360 [Arthrobacter ginkgonis]|uniref:Uncharacterized protein n=1 Tax=Arthrobacter ginkgonis TaxID=1630594 RepID=A0ABP7CR86_9MICC